MHEMFDEIDCTIDNKKRHLARLKDGMDAPMVSECDRHYLVCLARNSLDTWLKCRELLERYRVHRHECDLPFMSKHFEDLMEMEINRSPGMLTVKTRKAMVEYMKKLEWRLEQVKYDSTGFK